MLIPLGVTLLVYLWGMRHAWGQAGMGHGISMRRGLSFLGAVLALVAALVSPLDALSEALFSAHMVQHLILMLIAAPLLVLSDYPVALLWALPRRWAHSLARRLNRSQSLNRAWRLLTHPVTAWLLFTMALWTWHASALYEAALRDPTIHVVEHLVYLLTAMLFLYVLFQHTGPNHVRYGIAIPYLFATATQSGILGALMTFTTQPWYGYYATLVQAWGLTPLQDQQLAGVIMWIPGGAIFNLMTIGYFAAWLRALEQRAARAESSHSTQTHR